MYLHFYPFPGDRAGARPINFVPSRTAVPSELCNSVPLPLNKKTPFFRTVCLRLHENCARDKKAGARAVEKAKRHDVHISYDLSS